MTNLAQLEIFQPIEIRIVSQVSRGRSLAFPFPRESGFRIISVGDRELIFFFQAIFRQIGIIDVVDLKLFRVHRFVSGILQGARILTADKVLHGPETVKVLETTVCRNETFPGQRKGEPASGEELSKSIIRIQMDKWGVVRPLQA